MTLTAMRGGSGWSNDCFVSGRGTINAAFLTFQERKVFKELKGKLSGKLSQLQTCVDSCRGSRISVQRKGTSYKVFYLSYFQISGCSTLPDD